MLIFQGVLTAPSVDLGPFLVGGEQKICDMFIPDPWENDGNLTVAYFSKGLAQPPTSFKWIFMLSWYKRGGGNSNEHFFGMFYTFIWGRWTHFDEHIFQTNH